MSVLTFFDVKVLLGCGDFQNLVKHMSSQICDFITKSDWNSNAQFTRKTHSKLQWAIWNPEALLPSALCIPTQCGATCLIRFDHSNGRVENKSSSISLLFQEKPYKWPYPSTEKKDSSPSTQKALLKIPFKRFIPKSTSEKKEWVTLLTNLKGKSFLWFPKT